MIAPEEKRVGISKEIDVAKAVSEARRLAETAGFGETQQYMIATAVSELASNIFLYAVKGNIHIKLIERNTQRGIEIIAEDSGPGIEDIAKAMKDGFSTSEGLGLGLGGVKRLMDEFVFDIERTIGTKISVRKWV